VLAIWRPAPSALAPACFPDFFLRAVDAFGLVADWSCALAVEPMLLLLACGISVSSSPAVDAAASSVAA
jgi:hypothetical protein